MAYLILHLYLTYKLFLALSCPVQFTIPNTAIDFTTSAYGSVLVAVCLEGYILPEQATRTFITCDSDGTWHGNHIVDGCQRAYDLV